MIGDKRVLAVTLARGGSKRVLNKNMRTVAGKPLLQHTIDAVKHSLIIDKYVVSSDDIETLEFVESLGVLTHVRSQETSCDTATSADAIREVLATVHEHFDYLVEVMCTNPMKTVDDIDSVIAKLHETGADSVVSVTRIWDHHPSRVKFIENDVLCDFYPEVLESRRQDLTPPAYVRNGSIYAVKRDSFERYGTRVCGVVRPYIMPESRSINIDEEMDLVLADAMMRRTSC